MPIDYEALRFIWWLLLVVLVLGFALTDGFDLGAVVLLPLIGKTDQERSTILKSILPVWEGNQVWFVLGGGAIFAAWPTAYGVSFSGLYLAMFLLLLTFIMRPVSFKYRDKRLSFSWRYTWDRVAQISATLACIVFGVAVGNVIQGLPFEFDTNLRSFYTGSFLALFNPFALLCGVLSLVMLSMHGGFYVACKTKGAIQKRAQKIAKWCAILVAILFVCGGFWITEGIQGYIITSAIDHHGPSNPLFKTVTTSFGAWMHNYETLPALWIFPILGLGSALLAFIFSSFNRLAFIASGLTITGVLGTTAVSLFPFILPSSTHPSMSLTVWDSSASQLGLFLMLIATVILLPIVMVYITWVYRTLRGKID